MPFAPGYYIINTAKANSRRGIHWVSVCQTPKTLYVYDSFGRPTKSILKSLVKRSHQKKLKIVESDNDKEQRDNSDICGQLCMAFLCVVKQYGIREALKI